LTFAHPAAVLPLFRGPLVPAALIVGSMSPDVPYFLRATGISVSAQSWYEPFFNATRTHTPGGALTVALAMALVVYLCLKAAERPVMTLLPDATGSRRADRAPTPVAVSSGWVLLSLVIGIATHLVWDSFTHADGWVVENVSALREPLIGSLSAARVLQHVSTALGLLVIAYVVWRRRAQLIPERGAAARARLAWALAGAAAAGLAGAAVMTALRWERETTAEHVLSSAAVGAGLGVAVAVALAVAAWWLIHLTRNGADSRHG
jgi:hypothetical protein